MLDYQREVCKTTKQKVEYCLKTFKAARNSDKVLFALVIREFYPAYVRDGYIKLEDLILLPHANTVRRARTVIQNKECKYLPTDWLVAKARRWEKKAWKESTQFRLGLWRGDK
jgi:hypothetical protein